MICSYEVHAVVFLFKANVSGAISTEESTEITLSIRMLLSRLCEAASSEDHIAFRYSELFNKLFRKDVTPPNSTLANIPSQIPGDGLIYSTAPGPANASSIQQSSEMSTNASSSAVSGLLETSLSDLTAVDSYPFDLGYPSDLGSMFNTTFLDDFSTNLDSYLFPNLS